ncbi:hypothetical protein P167DRAFT_1242 [Morchella conica CCBAS932]|uniref:non-specific serine/threonine protein kinase n=1 Tax=Morchella conica CCBAS932 TaxID=1392247 RepID=A0A3N4LHS0_9PEZI|nr:hypothetical protein P167DRAFT_1242 [Morchella conica CCBAS932]
MSTEIVPPKSRGGSLAPPPNDDLSMRRPMERTPSMSIRAEKEDLKEAAEESFNVIMDLNLDGKVRWVSPSWEDVIGTPRDTVHDKPISDFLLDDKEVFKSAVEQMRIDDTRSCRVRFSVAMGSKSTWSGEETTAGQEEAFPMEEVQEEAPHVLHLEGQGIIIQDKQDGEPSHTMWVLRPFVEPNEITIDLPPVLVESLGVGAGMLARYLTSLAEQGAGDPANNPPPMPVLCRICERQIQPWWFEKHSELCMLEHKAESDVQLCQENLGMHRHAIVKILDAMERRSSRPVSGEITVPPTPIEYRGLPIGPGSSSSSGTASPAASSPKQRDSSASGNRSRSFPARRPLVRIVELLLDLCDTAIEISTPAIKESYAGGELGSFRTQSPQSEARINQVMQWTSPSYQNEEGKGLIQLCQDTEAVARAKVEAVFRHRNTIEYSERIRLEFAVLVQDCIDEALRKASEQVTDEPDDSYSNSDGEDSGIEDDTPFFSASFGPPLNTSSLVDKPRGRLRRHSSPADSGSTSPMECPTPKSQQSLTKSASRRHKFTTHRGSIHFDNDGADSDTSGRSSLAAAMGRPQTESPVSDHELTAARFAARDKRRTNAIQIGQGLNSPRRQASPARTQPSSSPLRINKPRNVLYDNNMPTPITSPLLSTGDFSPALEGFNHHHRRQSSVTSSGDIGKPPVSPRLPSTNPTQQQNRAVPPSIKDFEIIKPISKGAFGSVYLSKKKSTGDYFAIKVLKKADMIAKNQVTNVRAERAIMMVQGESDFVAKLFWTFASKDYLYLVMEYLNGGDCAALIKILGGIPEEWARKYLAEVVLGVEHLHARGIVHRDLKPDNLLIDQKGHLKLTDFGLSRMGLLGRQKRAQNPSSESTPDLLKQGPFARSRSVASSRSTSYDFPPGGSPQSTPLITPDSSAQLVTPSYFNLNHRESTLSRESSLRRSSNGRSETGGSDHLVSMLGSFSLDHNHGSSLYTRRTPTGDEDAQSESSTSSDFSAGLGLQHVATYASMSQSHVQPHAHPMLPPQMALFDPEDSNRKFVGTPDYLAPETINGSGQDEMSDWWSLGCILFEFLYGYPPFNAETHEQVFDNILNRRIAWPEEDEDDEDEDEAGISDTAKDLINRLMCTDPTKRLGVGGAEEVKRHPWFAEIKWDTLLEETPQFVPTPQDPEDTEYFDSRGATLQAFNEEFEDQTHSPQVLTPGADLPERPHDAVSRVRKEVNSSKRGLIPLSIPPHVREGRNRRLSETSAQDDFGAFTFKNLPVLDKANKDVIQKLRTEALKSTPALTTSNPASPSEGSPILSSKSLSRTLSNPSSKHGKRPVSPSNLHHSNPSPARASQPSSPLLMSFTATGLNDRRKASNASASSSLSQHSLGPLQPVPLVDIPRLPAVIPNSAKSPIAPSSTSSSPTKTHSKPFIMSSASTSPTKTAHDKLTLSMSSQPSPSKTHVHQHHHRNPNPRVRSLTIGSTDGDAAVLESFKHQKRRSQVFDMSPSSSDNEEVKGSALLRVQRRRQSSRRMSNISLGDTGPVFRPLDILVCEDHPVSKLVMERLLERLKCRTIVVNNGAEAMRCAMGEVKFDIILMEFKLPQINGEDVARMIRTSRNPNSNTPIVAVTGYLKDLNEPHHFTELIEKPATIPKLTEVLERNCHWKPAGLERPLADRRELYNSHKLPPVNYEESGRISPTVERFMSMGTRRGRLSEQFSSMDDDDAVSVTSTSEPVVLSRTTTNEWEKLHVGKPSSLGLEILPPAAVSSPLAPLTHQESAPSRLQSHTIELI